MTKPVLSCYLLSIEKHLCVPDGLTKPEITIKITWFNNPVIEYQPVRRGLKWIQNVGEDA